MHQADGDAGQPDPERRRLAKGAKLLEADDEGLLDYLLAFVAIGQQTGGDGEQVVHVSAIEHVPAPAVATHGARDQLRIADRVSGRQQGRLHAEGHR